MKQSFAFSAESSLFLPVWAIVVLMLRTYSSPIHQHGGCAGSVRVVHGKLACKLYDSVLADPDEPMSFKTGDCKLQFPDPKPREVLELQAGDTTWLNRQSWFVHAVHCSNDDTIEPKDFTLSIHFYKSCTDEFAFMAAGEGGRVVKKGQPKNDLFWNYDLEDGHKHYLQYYEDGKKTHVVPNFEKEASMGELVCSWGGICRLN